MIRTEPVRVNVPVYVALPAELTAPVAQPKLLGGTNGALADYVIALEHALDRANAQLQQIAGMQPAHK